ncbi:MAG: hypothetical protein AMXMBFR84_23140 [Candidatus Hydrogenedentota bacterium]
MAHTKKCSTHGAPSYLDVVTLCIMRISIKTPCFNPLSVKPHLVAPLGYCPKITDEYSCQIRVLIARMVGLQSRETFPGQGVFIVQNTNDSNAVGEAMLGFQGKAQGAPNIQPFRVLGPEGLPIRERSDEDLMLAHGRGSEESFGELVRRHQKGVLNYVYRMVQNRQIAEELTQEVFIALVRNAERYQPTAKFTTYLYTIASNIVSKEWLRQKRRPKLLSLSYWNRSRDEDDEFNPLDHAGDERANVFAAFTRGEISEAVNAALKELPEHQREAFVLRRFRDLSYEEIAEVTDSPVGTVKSRVVRAERALRPLLDKFKEYV